jgi:hypothetical protein
LISKLYRRISNKKNLSKIKNFERVSFVTIFSFSPFPDGEPKRGFFISPPDLSSSHDKRRDSKAHILLFSKHNQFLIVLRKL